MSLGPTEDPISSAEYGTILGKDIVSNPFDFSVTEEGGLICYFVTVNCIE